MQTPTIVKQTKDYLLIKIPLPQGKNPPQRAHKGGDKMTAAQQRGWKRLQEAERDVREGRVIIAPSIKEALRRYEKWKWH